jgi:hypothetical protein
LDIYEILEPFTKFESLKLLQIKWPNDDILDDDGTLHALKTIFKNKVLEEFVLEFPPQFEAGAVVYKRINNRWYSLSWPSFEDTDEGDDE